MYTITEKTLRWRPWFRDSLLHKKWFSKSTIHFYVAVFPFFFFVFTFRHISSIYVMQFSCVCIINIENIWQAKHWTIESYKSYNFTRWPLFIASKVTITIFIYLPQCIQFQIIQLFRWLNSSQINDYERFTRNLRMKVSSITFERCAPTPRFQSINLLHSIIISTYY